MNFDNVAVLAAFFCFKNAYATKVLHWLNSDTLYRTDLVHSPENLFTWTQTNLNSSPDKAQKPFRENEMTSFSGKCPD